ncbi:hypothetical protein GGF43_005318 [Coemansia sp. RSA 2618]|nr:hypothetical protein GGF43_005318 [Coemansia sp. RSA 2618]
MEMPSRVEREQMRRAALADDLMNDSSGTETDLDLPEPDTFLSSPPPTGARREAAEEIVLAPETPPSATAETAAETAAGNAGDNGNEEELLQTPKSAKKYAARSTPRSERGRKRPSAGRSLATQPERPAPPKRRAINAANDRSSMTAVESSSVSDDAPQDTPGSPPRTPRKPRRALDTARTDPPPKRTRTSQTPRADNNTESADALRVLTTGLTDAQTSRLQRAAKQLSAKTSTPIAIHTSTSKLLNDTTTTDPQLFTHVVTPARKTSTGPRCMRTFKYLVGLVAGARIVTPDWLLESAKRGSLLGESAYAVAGDTAVPNHTISGPRRIGALLAGYVFYVWGDGKDLGPAHAQSDLVLLMRVAGARVVDELPEPSDELPEPSDEISQPDDGNVSDGEAGSGVRRATGGMDKELAGVPTKYRRPFEKPVAKDETIVLVDGAGLKGTRCSVTMGAVIAATNGKLPCRTKAWLFDCISSDQII